MMATSRWQPSPGQLGPLKGALFLLCLLPFARLVVGVLNDGLGPNPLEFITRFTGTWTFNFLLITLTVTPLRKLAGLPWLIRIRRMLGLFCFFYACLHFLTFVWFDHFFDWQEIVRDVAKRPFVTAGFTAFLLLVPLALTSSNWAVRRLGGKRWQTLHRLVYAIGIVACVHYFWLVKPIALIYPLTYSLMLAVLLGWRAKERIRAFGPWPVVGAPSGSAPQPAAARPLQFFRQRPK